ncbi:unnamed protein product [Acanthoscelides obtectus]|uniref:Uncharacterized protein n=1 Tax=Acanthoscelides obtectus TaxID=200917 RepID=A0A9P0KX69_ACAOB|nr:unnamed protein product [Acanthoscelides obtectus]CAK1656726.1 hypothetical protein AOBTE_LOCUS19887 [Acanthoscelides obtectus]
MYCVLDLNLGIFLAWEMYGELCLCQLVYHEKAVLIERGPQQQWRVYFYQLALTKSFTHITGNLIPTQIGELVEEEGLGDGLRAILSYVETCGGTPVSAAEGTRGQSKIWDPILPVGKIEEQLDCGKLVILHQLF